MTRQPSSFGILRQLQHDTIVCREDEIDVFSLDEGGHFGEEIVGIDSGQAFMVILENKPAVIGNGRGPDEFNVLDSLESPVNFQANFRAAREDEDIGHGKVPSCKRASIISGWG